MTKNAVSRLFKGTITTKKCSPDSLATITSFDFNFLMRMSEIDSQFSMSSQGTTSKSPFQPLPALTSYPIKIPRRIVEPTWCVRASYSGLIGVTRPSKETLNRWPEAASSNSYVVMNIAQTAENIPLLRPTVHLYPLCTNAAAVPSWTRRTAPSAIPFV